MQKDKYGELPKELGTFEIECNEMMFYQYLPVKMNDCTLFRFEKRLQVFYKLMYAAKKDFALTFGYEELKKHYIYLTVKRMYQSPNTSFNRMGWHSDGFLTDDINYIWSDKYPTIFNKSDFNLTLDDNVSLKEMELQAIKSNDVFYKENQLLRLNQYNIHKVANVETGCMRTFVKISFSKDKYDLKGNSHNYLLDYDWIMKDRKEQRNIPQSNIILHT